MGINEWRVVRQPSGTTDTDVFDVRPIRDAVNRFARAATVVFIDSTGTKESNYPRGQRVELEISTDGGSTFTRRWAGFVQDKSRVQRENANLELELVGYDQLLRRNTSFQSFSSTAKSTIVENLIKDHTPVNWVAGNVSFVDDSTMDLDLNNERIDEAISRVVSESANEQFGVNDDFEFFLEDREPRDAPGDILDGEWSDYDLPEKNNRAINQVRLFFGSSGSEGQVIVEDRAEQRSLKNDLNAPRRVVLSETVTYPSVSSEDAARALAREILEDRSPIQTGTVTSFDRFDWQPGDVFRLQISERDIDDEFRVAELEWYWLRDETIVTVAEAVGELDQLLVGLSDDVKRVSARDADSTTTPTRFLNFRSGVTVSNSVTVRQRTKNSSQYDLGIGGSASTPSLEPMDNTGFQFDTFSSITIEEDITTASMLNMMRDVWQGESQTDISHLGVGSSDASVGVQQNSLDSQIDRIETATIDGTSTSVDYRMIGTISPSNKTVDNTTIREYGFFDADTGNNMYARLTTNDHTHDGTTETRVLITSTVDVDGTLRGVITTTGQERLVDLVTGETGHEPDEMVYGTGTSDPAESDTSLGNRQHADTIDSTADRSTGITDIVERITAADADTTNFSEVGYENSSNELLARIVFEALNSDEVVETNYSFRARNA